MNEETFQTIERWLRMLPTALVETRPWLLLVKALTLQYTWQLGAQVRVLDQIDALLDLTGVDPSAGDMPPGSNLQPDSQPDSQSGTSGARLRAFVALMRGQHAFYSNQPQRALELLATVMPRVSEIWTYVRGATMLYTGVCMQAAGQGEAADRLLVDCFERYEKKADPFGLRLLMPLCFNYFAQGKLEQVRQTAATMLRLCANQSLATMQSWGHYFLGLAHFEWNQPAAAEAHFAAIAERRHVATQIVVRDALHQLALVQHQRGKEGEAWRTLEMLSDLELEQNGREDEATRGLRARLQFMRGDVEGASRWADAFTAPIPNAPLIWVANPHLIKARILLEKGYESDLPDAQHILEALLAVAEQTYNTRFCIKILALLAVVYARQGCDSKVQQVLQRAYDLAKPGGFVRVFVELGPTMQVLLTRMAQKDVGVQRLLAAFADVAPTAPPAAASPEPVPAPGPRAGAQEPLTPREIQVLALLSEPLSSKELAAKLDVSHATLKRHLANIYGKLGVTRRWDAVAQAKALGLLSPDSGGRE